MSKQKTNTPVLEAAWAVVEDAEPFKNDPDLPPLRTPPDKKLVDRLKEVLEEESLLDANSTMAIEEMKAQKKQCSYVNDHGTFAPPSRMAELARELTRDVTGQEVAERIGSSGPRVSEAIHNKNLPVAIEIVRAYSDYAVEGPLYRISKS